MQHTTGSTLTERLFLIAPQRLFVMSGLAAVLGGAAYVSLDGVVQQIATVAGISLTCLVVILFILRSGHRIAGRQSSIVVIHFIANDIAPSFITTQDGQIASANSAADRAFGKTQDATLASVLADKIGNPGPTLFRLQSRAAATGASREAILTNSGQILLAVHSINKDKFAWRIEMQSNQPSGGVMGDGRILPMLMVGRSGAILSMNHAARQFIGVRKKSLDGIFAEQIVVPGTVMQVSTTTGN